MTFSLFVLNSFKYFLKHITDAQGGLLQMLNYGAEGDTSKFKSSMGKPATKTYAFFKSVKDKGVKGHTWVLPLIR